MKTNGVPAVIMLTAGLVDCILSIYCRLSLWRFTWQLLLVLVIFYVLGCIVKIIIDCNFKEMSEDSTETETDIEEAIVDEDGEEGPNENDNAEELENIDSDEESE